MALQERAFPYTWVSWITGLLAGDEQCQFSAWFRSHYQGFAEVFRPGFDLEKWKADHNTLVQRRVLQLREAGWGPIGIEDQNSLKLKGQTIVLAGKPDIVAHHEAMVLVSDIKSGKKRAKDYWQVMVYLTMAPRIWKHLAGLRWAGEVVYANDMPEPIAPPTEAGGQQQKIFDLMRVLGQATPPRTVPSAQECAFCPITKADCPDRIEGAEVTSGTTTEF